MKKKKTPQCDLIILNRLKSKLKEIKRIFFLVSKTTCIRGKHAHKKCSQLFYLINGKVELKVSNQKGNTKNLVLNKITPFVLIKPMVWVEVKLIRKTNLMVMCNCDFDEKDYIRNYDRFLNYNVKT